MKQKVVILYNEKTPPAHNLCIQMARLICFVRFADCFVGFSPVLRYALLTPLPLSGIFHGIQTISPSL
jgi:hypothetical protein